MPERKAPIHLPPRYPLDGQPLVYLTVCTDQRKPILCRLAVHDLMVDTWQKADHWLVGRYVIMPDHVHLFCSPAQWYIHSLAKWVQYWKAMISRQWPWPKEQPIWQRSFWDTQLRKEEQYLEKWKYVQLNPVRKEFTTDPKNWLFQGELHEFRW